MSKYDFEVDLSQNSSTGMILSKIPMDATVLEFGCATGRMTRYMREALSCQVYIVELEQAAFDVARQYAVDGLCDDIMSFHWVERFRDVKFDAIVFADVLEHLPAPERVLHAAKALLKDSGSIHISLPNITHNDIILKACGERFDYTATGLLDDTHIHFWGLENLEKLAVDSGMTLRSVEATYCDTGATEQFAQAGSSCGVLLGNILKSRTGGEIYQFVITLDRKPEPGGQYRLRAPALKSHIYLDTGKDFNADEIIAFSAEYVGNGTYIAHFELEDSDGVRRLRFDPVEGQGCILQNLTVFQNGGALHLNCPGGVSVENGVLLLGQDPMVYTNDLPGGGPVTVHAEIILWGEQYLELLERAHVSSLAAFRDKCLELDRVRGEVANCHRQIADLHLLRQEDHRVFAGKEASYENRIAGLNGEIDRYRRDIGSYIVLVNQKDMYAMTLEKDLQYYTRLPVVKAWVFLGRAYKKLRNFAGRILRGLKRRVKRLLGKGE